MKKLKALTLAALTAVTAVTAPVAKADNFEDHNRLWQALENNGVDVSVNHPEHCKKNWGGANIHHNKELNKYILEYPEFNKLLVSDLSENIEHSTTMTTPMSDNRITIQMFI